MKAQYKLRSHETNLRHHESLSNDKIQYTHLLLGASMLENLSNPLAGLPHFQHLQSKALIFNAGVGGDKVENLMYRLVDGKLIKNPYLAEIQNVYLLIGTNNLNNKNNKCKNIIVDGTATIIYLLTKNLPLLQKIYVMKISPRTDIKQELIDEVNVSLLEMVDKTPVINNVKICYLDWCSELLNENRQINTQYYFDHVHLNTEGYKFMCDCIDQTIEDQKNQTLEDQKNQTIEDQNNQQNCQ